MVSSNDQYYDEGTKEDTPLLSHTSDIEHAPKSSGTFSRPHVVNVGGKTHNRDREAQEDLVNGWAINVPPWVRDVYTLPSFAIIMSYFSVGVVLELITTPITYYLIDDLGASSGQYTVYSTLTTLPWTFKVLYGLLSDSVPIAGLRRKPYFLIGWGTHVAFNIALAAMGEPGINSTIFLSFLGACGYLLADVMTDAIVVERTKMEPRAMRGAVQASGYIARYFGSAIGATAGTVLYNSDSWGWGLTISQLFLTNALVPLVMIGPFFPFLVESAHQVPKDCFRRHCEDIWSLVQKRAVWQPMAFIYIYNMLMIPNSAWTNFLVEGLDFSNFKIGVVSIAGSVAAWVGLVLYKKHFFQSNWRSVYLITSLVDVVFSVLQLMLIFGWNQAIGLNDLWFAAGDDAAIDFIMAIQFLPACVMYAVMCPDGTEGTTYAMLTTLNNLAYTVAYAIGDLCTGIWDVSNDSLAAHDYSGLWKLTLFTSLIQVSPLVLLGLLPADKEEQLKLQKSTDSSRWAGAAFLAVLAASMIFSVGESIWELS